MYYLKKSLINNYKKYILCTSNILFKKIYIGIVYMYNIYIYCLKQTSKVYYHTYPSCGVEISSAKFRELISL